MPKVRKQVSVRVVIQTQIFHIPGFSEPLHYNLEYIWKIFVHKDTFLWVIFQLYEIFVGMLKMIEKAESLAEYLL